MEPQITAVLISVLAFVVGPGLAGPKWVWIPDDPRGNGSHPVISRQDGGQGTITYNYHYHQWAGGDKGENGEHQNTGGALEDGYVGVWQLTEGEDFMKFNNCKTSVCHFYTLGITSDVNNNNDVCDKEFPGSRYYSYYRPETKGCPKQNLNQERSACCYPKKGYAHTRGCYDKSVSQAEACQTLGPGWLPTGSISHAGCKKGIYARDPYFATCYKDKLPEEGCQYTHCTSNDFDGKQTCSDQLGGKFKFHGTYDKKDHVNGGNCDPGTRSTLCCPPSGCRYASCGPKSDGGLYICQFNYGEGWMYEGSYSERNFDKGPNEGNCKKNHISPLCCKKKKKFKNSNPIYIG